MQKTKKILMLALFFSLAGLTFFLCQKFVVEAATFFWQQDSWVDPATSDLFTHTPPAGSAITSGWDKYSEKTSNASLVNGDVTISIESLNKTHTKMPGIDEQSFGADGGGIIAELGGSATTGRLRLDLPL